MKEKTKRISNLRQIFVSEFDSHSNMLERVTMKNSISSDACAIISAPYKSLRFVGNAPQMHTNRLHKMSSEKRSKSSEALRNIAPKEPIVISTKTAAKSEHVLKWIDRCRDQCLLNHFDVVVHELESRENRIRHPKGDGWYSKFKANHLHFYGRFSVFYRYTGTDLTILAVMGKARNDRDYEFV